MDLCQICSPNLLGGWPGLEFETLRPCSNLSALNLYGVRFGRLPGERIWCYLQDLYIALSCLLLVILDGYNLTGQSREFHFQIEHGDNGSKLIKCLLAD